MISFELFTKDDFSILLDGFDTFFLQVPLKRPAKTLLKFIPNGFRPEKLQRTQINKVYIEALWAREQSVANYIKDEMQRNLQKIGIDDYVSDKLNTDYPINQFILELSAMIWENHLVLPAHLVLLSYGVDCGVKDKEISLRLHDIFHSQRKEAHDAGIEQGSANAEKKYADDLEAERKMSRKLQTKLESLTEKGKANSDKAEADRKTKEILETKIAELTTRNQDQDNRISQLSAEITKLQSDIESKNGIVSRLNKEINDKTTEVSNYLKQIQTLTSNITELENQTENSISFSLEQIEIVCKEAIEMLDTNDSRRKAALAKAKSLLSGEDINTSWNHLCDMSNVLLGQITTAIRDNILTQDDFDKFDELETILLLMNVIQKAVCAMAHRTFADSIKEQTLKEVYRANNG